MAPKDKRNVLGLCGYFDADVTNDLVHSDGKTSTLNAEIDYFKRHHEEFINSWRFV
jgi:ribulose kinase